MPVVKFNQIFTMHSCKIEVTIFQVIFFAQLITWAGRKPVTTRTRPDNTHQPKHHFAIIHLCILFYKNRHLSQRFQATTVKRLKQIIIRTLFQANTQFTCRGLYELAHHVSGMPR